MLDGRYALVLFLGQCGAVDAGNTCVGRRA